MSANITTAADLSATPKAITSNLNPVSTEERVELLDVLRGFAIFGIFVANLWAFTGYGFMSPEQQAALPTASADKVVKFLITLFVEGKFYSLFSLLFGVGFAVQMRRAEEHGRPFVPLFRRRLTVLLLIGLLHLVLIWSGDILTLYALMGFLLIPFRHRRDRTLLIWAAALIVSPVLLYSLMVVSGGVLNPGMPFGAAGMWLIKAMGPGENVSPFVIYSQGGWSDFFKANLVGAFFRYSDLLYTSRLPKVLGMFLIGFCIGRRMIFRDFEAYRPLLRHVFWWGLSLGLVGNIALAILEYDGYYPPSPLGILTTTAYALGVAPLSLCYAVALTNLWQRPTWQARLAVLAPVGRMALTNYLLQTVIGITLFYSIGFGLMGTVGPTLWTVLAIVVFTAQVVFSKLWLRHFRYGPVEWLWRSLTYGTRQPMRLPRQEPATAQ